MRRAVVMLFTVACACAEAPPAQPVAAPAARPIAPAAAAPASRPAAPAAAGTPAQQDIRALNRALGQPESAPRQRTGEPGYSPFDIGGAGQMPEMPDQVSPAFRGL
jgi:DNA polymerase-3 subunit gamma/tau